MAQKIQLKRGLEANRLGYTPLSGEPLWTTDEHKLFIGDGTTAGGIDFVSTITANYILTTEKGAANGVATLDSNSKIPAIQLPAIAITDTFVVASESEMLALTAQTGDVAIRTDIQKNFILRGTDPSALSDWQELVVPADSVTSVNGETGVVVLDTDDVGEGVTNLYFTDGRADARVQAAIDDGNPSSTTLYSSDKIEQIINEVLNYKGGWDASTNTPTLSDSTGAKNDWYIVKVGGTQDLGSGSITFTEGDNVIHNGTIWERFHSADAVDSVNGETGVVVLDSDDISEGTTNLYFTDTRADARIAAASIDDLSDVDTSTTAPTDGQILIWDNANSVWVPDDSPAGVTTFVGLSDTPADYTGAAGKIVAVKSDQTGLEYIDTIDGGTF